MSSEAENTESATADNAERWDAVISRDPEGGVNGVSLFLDAQRLAALEADLDGQTVTVEIEDAQLGVE